MLLEVWVSVSSLMPLFSCEVGLGMTSKLTESVTKFGHFNPWIFLGTALVSIAGGVQSTWKITTSDANINGIQVMGGAGSAMVISIPLIALLSLLPEPDLPAVTSIAVFFQFFGGAIFLAISESILVSRLTSALTQYAPAVDAALVIKVGAEGLRKVVTAEQLPGALVAYNKAITGVFYLTVAGGAVAFFASFGVEWRSVKGKQAMVGDGSKAKEVEVKRENGV